MGETKLVIDIKKERLRREVENGIQNKQLINKLKKDIVRHVKWEKRRLKKKRKQKKKLKGLR